MLDNEFKKVEEKLATLRTGVNSQERRAIMAEMELAKTRAALNENLGSLAQAENARDEYFRNLAAAGRAIDTTIKEREEFRVQVQHARKEFEDLDKQTEKTRRQMDARYNELYAELQAAGAREAKYKLLLDRAAIFFDGHTYNGTIYQGMGKIINDYRTTKDDMGTAKESQNTAGNAAEINGPCGTPQHSLYTEPGDVCPHCQIKAKRDESIKADAAKEQAAGVSINLAGNAINPPVKDRELSAAEIIRHAVEAASGRDKAAGDNYKSGLVTRVEAVEQIAERADRRVTELGAILQEQKSVDEISRKVSKLINRGVW